MPQRQRGLDFKKDLEYFPQILLKHRKDIRMMIEEMAKQLIIFFLNKKWYENRKNITEATCLIDCAFIL